MGKLNCWEYIKCGREVGGLHADDIGVCPVTIEKRGDGINGGKNGGRICWAVARMFFSDNKQGICNNSFVSCLKCDFFKLVAMEEGYGMKTSQDLLPMLRNKE